MNILTSQWKQPTSGKSTYVTAIMSMFHTILQLLESGYDASLISFELMISMHDYMLQILANYM